MDCDSAPDHPIHPLVTRVIDSGSSSASTSTSDSELDVHSIPNTLRQPVLTESQIPPAPVGLEDAASPLATQRAPSQLDDASELKRPSEVHDDEDDDVAPLPKRPLDTRASKWPTVAPTSKRPDDVVSSDALDKFHNFESQGVVLDRSHVFSEDPASLHVAPAYQTDINEGFESAGNVVERSQAFGKKEEEENLTAERELTGFESAGNVIERSQAFGKKEEEENLPAERELTGFESTGNVKDRASIFQRPSEVNDSEEEEEKTEEEKKREEEEKQKEEEEEKERLAEQKRVAALPRDELKVYPYDVLTVRMEKMDDH